MDLIEKSIQVDDKFPNFSLLNTENKCIELGELLIKGKVIVAFFRGSWCPYCNLELLALQENLPYSNNTEFLSLLFRHKCPDTMISSGAISL